MLTMLIAGGVFSAAAVTRWYLHRTSRRETLWAKGRVELTEAWNEKAAFSLALPKPVVAEVSALALLFAWTARKKAPQAFLHCDAIQAFLKIPLNVHRLGCDAVSVSAHKVGGMKGVGALWYTPEVEKQKRLSPVIYGGGQEAGLRSGTENTVGIASFGGAVTENSACLAESARKCRALTEQIISALGSTKEISFNLPPMRAPHILSITHSRVRSETLVHFLSAKGIFVSAGSACSSHAKHPSSSLISFGLTPDKAEKTVRVSLSADYTPDDITYFCECLKEGVTTLAGAR